MDDPTDIPQLTPWMHQECCALTSLWCQIRPSHLVWRLENPLPTRQRWFNPFPADAWTKTSDQRRCDATGTDARLSSSGKACGQWIPGSRNLEQQTSNSQLQSNRGDPHAWHNDRKLRWHTGGGAYATRVAYLNRRSCTTILYAQKGYYSRIEQHVSRIQPPAKLSRDQLRYQPGQTMPYGTKSSWTLLQAKTYSGYGMPRNITSAGRLPDPGTSRKKQSDKWWEKYNSSNQQTHLTTFLCSAWADPNVTKPHPRMLN